MPPIIVTGDASRQLADASERVEVRDAEGRLLGVFEPGLSAADLQFVEQLRSDGCPMTILEYRQLQEEARTLLTNPERLPAGKTTAEIMAKLKSLP